MLELKKKVSDIKDEYNKLVEINNIDLSQKELEQINQKINSNDYWGEFEEYSKMMKKKSILENKLIVFQKLHSDIMFIEDLLQENNNQELMQEVAIMLNKSEEIVNDLRIKSLFKDKNDNNKAFLEINSGAGGVDSQDWVNMILRMYLMWFDKKGFKYEIIDKCEGEVGGLKSVSLEVRGELAFGFLKNENGIHRLVRISPFNANDKRQTSFAGVFCYPQIEENIEVKIDEKDIRIDVYRSSGAGGQHVNKTESAVRITHIPTGVVVQSQVQRSQIQNRENCMRMLYSKLCELERQRQNAGFAAANDGKSDISWGNQVRNYILHPYKMVKDLRSGFETANINNVLDGDLDEIINSVLSFNSKVK
jgi:peptide chain release factor 2